MITKFVPKLRFSEFSGEWEEKKLGKYVDILSGESPSKFKFVKDGIPYYKVEQLNDSNKYLKNSFYNIEETKKIVKKGSLIFPKRGASIMLNKIRILLDDSFIDTNLMSLYTKNTLFNEFLYYFILKVDLSKIADTTSIPQINNKHIEPYNLYLPKPKEQQKIANCLSSLDNLIEVQNKKVEVLAKHKKGLMQKLFATNDEKIPKLRFKGFSGEWEEKHLDNISIINMGQSPKSSSYNLYENGILLIQGNADILNRKTNPRQWTTECTKFCNIGDLILTVRAPVGFIAKSMHKACIGRGVCSIAKKENNNLEFIYQFLLSFEKKWISIEQGSTFTAVSGNDIKSLKLIVPKKPKEQQKIADCLSSLDNLIEVQNKNIQILKTHKKGLMQQLFVNSEVN
jgi:type I restriction enzyme S subunit